MSNGVHGLASSRFGVVGLGLIGGSILRALQAGHHEVVGWDTDVDVRRAASAAGFGLASSLKEIVQSSDLVFLCVPLDAIDEVFRAIAEVSKKEVRGQPLVLTDVGSVKTEVVAMADAIFEDVPVSFVAGHPMAGTEQFGFSSSFAGLFEAATWVVCESASSSSLDVCRVMQTVVAMGARTTLLDPLVHDRSVAAVSHLPYLAAAALALVVDGQSTKAVSLRLAAGSFRDGTRVAGSDPLLSEGMLSHNSEAVLDLAQRLTEILEAFQTALRTSDRTAIFGLFERAGEVRDQYLVTRGPLDLRTVELATDAASSWLHEYCILGGLVHSVSVHDDVVALTVEAEGSLPD